MGELRISRWGRRLGLRQEAWGGVASRRNPNRTLIYPGVRPEQVPNRILWAPAGLAGSKARSDKGFATPSGRRPTAHAPSSRGEASRASRLQCAPLDQRFEIDSPGRLLSVDSRQVPIYRFGVVVVGTGVAGATAALTAAEAGIEVALLSKASPEETNTLHAQGGVAAVLAPEDSLAEIGRAHV